MKNDAVVLVFARAPVPGRAKTRLVPALGEWRAARLQARLTERALRTALAARCGAVELHGAPDVRHRFFRHAARRFGIGLESQRGINLGERMFRALERALRRHRRALLIGSDAPALRPGDLRRAARLLQAGYDVVLSPAEDGGYALIGCRRVSPRLFAEVAWGGPRVYAQTVERLAELRYRWHALRTVWDVDRPEDLSRCYTLPPLSSRVKRG